MIDFEPVDRRPEIERRLAAKSPESRAFMNEMRRQMDEDDRIYKMQLAAIREAGHLTQVELASRLGKPKGNVSRIEHAKDMLYSTLLSYLEAAGATDIALTATIAGKRVEVGLAGVAH
jgi:ribosome-binding protein aMBF1 (putative translation factor)